MEFFNLFQDLSMGSSHSSHWFLDQNHFSRVVFIKNNLVIISVQKNKNSLLIQDRVGYSSNKRCFDFENKDDISYEF